MNLKSVSVLGNLLMVLLVSFTCCNKDDPSPVNKYDSLEAEINSIADKYVKVGAIVGIINKKQEHQVFPYGTKSINTTDLPDENTTFDIGSITKTFTATLAADMYLKGKIEDEIVEHYLPEGQVTMPTKGGLEITFIQLLTHTSGIPRTPHETGSDFPLPPVYNIENPYAAYTTAHIYDYLTNYCELMFTPGTWWEYSNTGVGLVGHVIGLIDGTNYETVLTRDLLSALSMDNTSLFLTEAQMSNLALGHDTNKKMVAFYTANDIFQGAGMAKSTLSDMFKFLEANMGLMNTPLRNSMEVTHAKIMHQGSMGDQGMAWWILELEDGQEIIYSGGNTNGHSSFIAFNRKESTGVIILFNSSNLDGTNIDMGFEVMEAIFKY